MTPAPAQPKPPRTAPAGAVEEAVLDATQTIADKTREVLADFKDGSWADEGLTGTRRAVDALLDCWNEHLVLMRTLTAVAAEGDPRFIRGYHRVTKPAVLALAAAIKRSHGPSTDKKTAKALAHDLVTMLAAAAGQEGGTRVSGLTKAARRSSLALIVHSTLTGIGEL